MQLIRKIYNKHIRLGFTCFSILGIWFDWICVVCGVVTHQLPHQSTTTGQPINETFLCSPAFCGCVRFGAICSRHVHFRFYFIFAIVIAKRTFSLVLLRTLRVWPKSWRIILSKANSFIRRHTSCLMKFWDKTIDRSDTRSHAAQRTRESKRSYVVNGVWMRPATARSAIG